MVADTRHQQSDAIHAFLADLWAEMKAAGFVPMTSTVLHDKTLRKQRIATSVTTARSWPWHLASSPPHQALPSPSARICGCVLIVMRLPNLSQTQRPEDRCRDANSWHHFDGKHSVAPAKTIGEVEGKGEPCTKGYYHNNNIIPTQPLNSPVSGPLLVVRSATPTSSLSPFSLSSAPTHINL